MINVEVMKTMWTPILQLGLNSFMAAADSAVVLFRVGQYSLHHISIDDISRFQSILSINWS